MIELLHRTFVAEGLVVDGRTVEGLAVPFGREAEVVDRRPGGGVVCYRESFVRGAFDRAEAVPHRVTFVYGHSDGFGDRMGAAASLTQTDAGLVARFRLDASRADAARDALATSHGALSIGFAPLVPRRGAERDGALVVREAVHLVHVAAVPEGAYADALVTSVRSLDEEFAALDAEAARAEDEEKQAARVRSDSLLSEIDRIVSFRPEWMERIAR